MVNGLVNIEHEHLGLLSLLGNKPLLSEVNEPATVDEHEQLHSFILPGVLNPLLEFCVGGHRIDFVMDALALKEFLNKAIITVSIFKVHKESMSVPVYTTTDT